MTDEKSPKLRKNEEFILNQLVKLEWLKDRTEPFADGKMWDWVGSERKLYDGSIKIKANGEIKKLKVEIQTPSRNSIPFDLISVFYPSKRTKECLFCSKSVRGFQVPPTNALNLLKSINQLDSIEIRKWGKWLDKNYDADLFVLGFSLDTSYQNDHWREDNLFIFSPKLISSFVEECLKRKGFVFNKKKTKNVQKMKVGNQHL